MSTLHTIFCTCYPWPWLGPLLTTVQYVMYFRFCSTTGQIENTDCGKLFTVTRQVAPGTKSAFADCLVLYRYFQLITTYISTAHNIAVFFDSGCFNCKSLGAPLRDAWTGHTRQWGGGTSLALRCARSVIQSRSDSD